jgi:hypothetical protein
LQASTKDLSMSRSASSSAFGSASPSMFGSPLL